MSKSGSSAGSRSGAGRKPRAAKVDGGRSDRSTKTPRQHAAERKASTPSIVLGPKPKSKAQQKKLAHQKRAEKKKKG